MGWLSYEEYIVWLEKHHNKEEVCAQEVVDEIIATHANEYKNYTPEFLPRKVINIDVEDYSKKLEFDLLIHLRHDTDPRFDRLISVEFKSQNAEYLVKQAIARRLFVDYSYIALKNGIYMAAMNAFLLYFYGIGYIIWNKNPRWAHTVIPAKHQWEELPPLSIHGIVSSTVRELVQFETKLAMKDIKAGTRDAAQKTLFEMEV